MKFYFYFLFVLIFIFNNYELVFAEQSKIIENIIQKKNTCTPNYFFSQEEVNGKNSNLTYREKIEKLANKNKKNKSKNLSFTSDFEIIPVNLCVLRSNRKFNTPTNEMTLKKELNTSFIINTDLLVNKAIEADKTQQEHIEYVYLPMNAFGYLKGQSLNSFRTALKYLSEATPDKRVLITCFFGKHRTGLLAASYQFVLEYANNPEEACKNLGTEKDKAFTLMNNIADKGVLTYNMPAEMKSFYTEFGKSVCNKTSSEFLKW